MWVFEVDILGTVMIFGPLRTEWGRELINLVQIITILGYLPLDLDTNLDTNLVNDLVYFIYIQFFFFIDQSIHEFSLIKLD